MTELPISNQIPLRTSVAWAASGPLLKWIGKNLAGGVVGAVGAKAFSEVLNLIGLGDQGMADLAKKLDVISSKLDEVQRSLDRLTMMTDEILTKLEDLKNFMAESLKQQELSAAIRAIEVVYGAPEYRAPSNNSKAVTLYELIVEFPRDTAMTHEQLEKHADNFAGYASGMPQAVKTISEVLTIRAFNERASLISHWASELIRQIKDEGLPQETACQILEGYFLTAIASQLKGVSMHCVAIGGQGESGERRINSYMKNTYAPMLYRQTRAFVRAIEDILFSTIPHTMPVGGQLGMGELREFPRKIDELLLRADLLAAAIDLGGTVREQDGQEVPLHESIQGIYGRALFRPCDLRGGQTTSLALNGYPAQEDKNACITPIHCLSMFRDNPGDLLKLEDAMSSYATMARYKWPFIHTVEVGTKIDPSQRDGVVPALYDVFGEGTSPVLAASFLDVTRLYRTAPQLEQQFETFGPFNAGNKHASVENEKHIFYRNPLLENNTPVFSWAYSETHAYHANVTFRSNIHYRLFSYQGAKTKVRMTAHFYLHLWRNTRLDTKGGTAFHQNWDLIEVLEVRKAGGGTYRLFSSNEAHFATRFSLQSDQNMAVGGFHENAADLTASVMFDLEPGEYQLLYDQHAWIAKKEMFRKWEGWQHAGITFNLFSVTLELVPA